MKSYSKLIALAICTLLFTPQFTVSQSNNEDDNSIAKYRRSSLYSAIIKHKKQDYSAEIDSIFYTMPLPDKFNNHNCECRTLTSTARKANRKGKKKDKTNLKDIATFIEENNIANQMIAKWFNFDETNAGFNLDLIKERGLYSASQEDIKMADNSIRGKAILADAGTDLIPNTFLLVNDITFVDHGENSKKAALALRIVGAFASAAAGSETNLGEGVAAITENIDGFDVRVTSYLYQLKWDNTIMNDFYENYWFECGDPNCAEKTEKFHNCDKFCLNYIGKSSAVGRKSTFRAFTKLTKPQQMHIACTRAIDKSIIELQREYDEFKVNVPIGDIDYENKTVEIPIGLKEGVNEESVYEVLMPIENEDGTFKYDRIGNLKPVKDQIWDNRYGALEEMQEKMAAQEGGADMSKCEDDELGNVNLTASVFEIISGSRKIMPGCLVRELKIK